MIQKHGITQLSYTGNGLYIQGAILQAGLGTADTYEVADQAQTALLASRDSVINEVSVGMSGAESEQDRVSGATPLALPGAINVPLEYCMVSIEPEQDLHGYEYPWPGGGNVNKYDEDSVTYGIWVSNDGSEVSNALYSCISTYISVIAGTTHTVKSYGSAPYSVAICQYDASYNFISRIVTSSTQYVFATSNTTAYIRVCVARGPDNTTPINAVYLASYKMSLNQGASIAEYYTYSNICPITGHSSASVYIEQTYDPTAAPKATTALGQTVYGGELDMIGGNGINNFSERTGAQIAGGTVAYNAQYQIFYFYPGSAKSNGILYCSKYKPVEPNSALIATTDCCCFAGKSGFFIGAIGIKDTSFNGDVAAFKASLTASDQFIFEIEPGVPFTTDPQPNIIPPAGDCEAWTDCGSMIDIVYTKQP